MKKRIFAIIATALCFALFICGCADNPSRESVEYLGASDGELIADRGEGEATSYGVDGNQIIQQRKYKEKLFGLDAQVEYLFSDNGFVNQIVAIFPNVSEQQLIEAASETLGESVALQKESDELDFMARWEAKGIAYVCRRIPNADLYILMEKLK